MKNINKHTGSKAPIYRNATDTEINDYNQYIGDKMGKQLLEEGRDTEAATVKSINTVKEAAEKHLKPVEQTQRRPYISDKTWELIEKRWIAQRNHGLE